MRIAADPASAPGDLIRPGHVLAGQIRPGARGAAAAALELAHLAGLEQVVALCPVLDDTGALAPLASVLSEPRLRWLPRTASSELHAHAAFRSAQRLAVTCELPTRYGHFRAVGFDAADDESPTVAFVHGDPAAAVDPPVHVHVACRAGDVFGSLLCTCRAELDAAIEEVIAAGSGVIVYTLAGEPGLLECSRGRRPDQATVAGLLRAIGLGATAARRLVSAALGQRPGGDDLEVCA